MICGQVGIAGSATYVHLHLIDELSILFGVSYNLSCLAFDIFPLCTHRLGDYVTLGGRVAIRDHVSIASKMRFSDSVLCHILSA
jgi:hypothetical protein